MVLTVRSGERKRKGTILVIDDESASPALLLTILTEDGYAVYERHQDLAFPFRLVKETQPDLLMVDVRKASLDGYQLCAGLKNDPNTRAIPVIFISSISGSMNQAKALVSGAVDYVTEPFDAEEVLWRIETHIALRRLREKLEFLASDHGAQSVVADDSVERAFREIHILTQITGRKHAEEKVRQAERELQRNQALFAETQRLSSTGTLSWNVATDEITCSEQLCRIYEIEIGMPVTLELIRTRVHPEDVGLIEKMRTVDQAQDDNEFEWQYRLMLPDHSVKSLHAVGRAIRGRDGKTEYIAAVQDITARRMSEEALATARSELAKVARVMSLAALTASIAHEVNQPLSGIVTNASTCLRMLEGDPPNVDGARETARRTIRDAKRGSDVIARLRALFRKDELMFETLDLNEVTREVIALSWGELQRAGVALRSELADDLPIIAGDRIQLQEVVLNLLHNASDAMAAVDDRPRQLLVRTEREGGDHVRVSVQDSGVGFDLQSMNKLFDAFYTTKSDGMGIGLSVSRSIVENHGGRLWAAANDGPGATFAFTIPVAPEARTGITRDFQASAMR